MKQRTVLFIGTATYAVLVLFSMLYFKERTIFLDAAFHLFQIVRTGDFTIQANRFGAVVTQIFPLLSVKLNLPTKWVMLNYSVGVTLYYFIVFLICTKVFKSLQTGLAMVLFNTFIVTYTFYWMQIELAQGIALTILLFGFLLRDKSWTHYTALEIALFFILLITILYFHPLLLFVYLFLVLFFLIDQTIFINKKLLYTSLIITGAVYFFKTFIFKGAAYDDAFMGNAVHNFKEMFPNYFTIEANKNFIKYCLKDYYLLPIGLGIATIYYIRQRSFYKLALLLSFFFAYLLLVNVAAYNHMPQFHIESFYLPLSIFIIFPLIYDVFPAIKNQKILIGVLILVLMVRLAAIGLAHRANQARINWEAKVLEATKSLPNKKLLLSDADAPMDTLLMSWGSSYEFWLLSSLQNEHPRSILIDEDPSRLDWALSNNKGMITEWGVFEYKDLPQRYFNFTDTTYYQKIDWNRIK